MRYLACLAPSLPIVGGILFGSLLAGAATAQETPRLLIGVISPLDGRQIGVAHEKSAVFGLGGETPMVDANGAAVELVVSTVNDEGRPQRAVELAQELFDRGAIAILGPIDSSSTEKVLAAQLEIPIISALSTASSLTGPGRNQWFFRATVSDAERTRDYVRVLRRKGLMGNRPIILYDENSAYGRGLKDDLLLALEAPATPAVSWSELDIALIANGNPAPNMLFVLGSSAKGVELARQLQTAFEARGLPTDEARYLFVGDDGDLRANAPLGSITIGEPMIEDDSSPRIPALRGDYAASGQAKDSFQFTTFEAANMLLQAVTAVVEQSSREPGGVASRSIQELRAELREKLETMTFDSLEPWRSMTFVAGQLQGAPAIPIYEASARELKLIEPPPQRAFLEVEQLPERAGFLQGRIDFRVRAHRATAKPAVRVLRLRNGGDSEPIEAHIETNEDLIQGWFYANQPGTYQVKGTLYTASRDTVEVVWSPAYLSALVGALVGSLLFTLSAPRTNEPLPWRRIALGVLTGLAVAAMDFHRAFVPGGEALPRLSDTPNLAAFWDGLAGGWVGPSLLVLVMGRLLPMFRAPKEA